jgi:hypothetical protein
VGKNFSEKLNRWKQKIFTPILTFHSNFLNRPKALTSRYPSLILLGVRQKQTNRKGFSTMSLNTGIQAHNEVVKIAGDAIAAYILEQRDNNEYFNLSDVVADVTSHVQDALAADTAQAMVELGLACIECGTEYSFYFQAQYHKAGCFNSSSLGGK